MSFQQLLIKGLLKLPASLLVKMSGGKPISIDGNTMDPRMQFLMAQGMKAPAITTLSPQDARTATDEGLALLDAKPRKSVTIINRAIPGPDGNELHVRVYVPAENPMHKGQPMAGMVYYHMGGFVIGNLETCNTFCSILAEDAHAIIVSVDYRLAPENKFPAFVDDAVHAYDYISEHRRDFGITSFQPLAVGGDSAGGMLSAVVCQEIKRKGGNQPKVQLLIYPAVDFADTSGSMESCSEVYPLTSDIMAWFADQAMSSQADLEDLRASPMREKDLSGLAPAIVATAGFDPLRDQGEAYAKRLSDADVKTTYICYDTLTHAFTAMSGVLPPAKAACEELAVKLGRMLR